MDRMLRRLSSDEIQKKKLAKAHKANYHAAGRRVMEMEREKGICLTAIIACMKG